MVKVMLKRSGWKEPVKFLGHGEADGIQKNALLKVPTNDLAVIALNAKMLYRQFGVREASSLVGLGISMGKFTSQVSSVQCNSNFTCSLESEETGVGQKAIDTAFSSAGSFGRFDRSRVDHTFSGVRNVVPRTTTSNTATKRIKYQVLRREDIDPQVFAELPEDIRLSFLKEVDQAERQRLSIAGNNALKTKKKRISAPSKNSLSTCK